MALAINTIDGWGLSNEAHRELLPKKRLYFPSFHSESHLTSCTLLHNKTERFSFKSRHAMQAVKPIKENLPIVLQ